MHCTTIRNKLPELSAMAPDQPESIAILQHLSHCETCTREYAVIRSTEAALTPAMHIQASDSLKRNIMNKIDNLSSEPLQKPKPALSFFAGYRAKIAAVAAVLLLAFGLLALFKSQLTGNKASAAQLLLQKSLTAFNDVHTMVIRFKVRSYPGENFEVVDTKGDLIDYTLWKEFQPDEKWKIEKPGLVVAMDGKKQYRYAQSSGTALVGSPESGFVEWMRILLNPANILQSEIDFAEKHKADYSISHTANEKMLTVKVKAPGDFDNPYMLNKSITEANTKRVYRFNQTTGQLLSVHIFVQNGNSETEILTLSNIEYNVDIPVTAFTIVLPKGVQWAELKDIAPAVDSPQATKTPEEAARLWFESLAKNDWETVFKMDLSLSKSARLDQFKQYFGGLQLLKLGVAFKSGNYTGVYVPYEIKLPSGESYKGNLALRNDNALKVWLFDGGL